jgi:hypothetical protein
MAWSRWSKFASGRTVGGRLARLGLLHALLVGCADEAPSGDGLESDDDAVDVDDDAEESDRDAAKGDSGRDGGPSRDARVERDAGRSDAASGTGGRDAATGSDDASRPRPGGEADAAMAPKPDASSPGPNPSGPPGEVCALWNGDRMDISEGMWSGNAESCQAGDMTPQARTNALRLLNLYRQLAGLSTVMMTDEGNKLAQDCALLMRANNTITHTPPTTFKCYTAEAAKTAGGSSLSSGPAVSSVDLYMIDPGNATTLGHRRWILSNWLTTVGFGSADRFSCQYQPARAGGAGGKAFVAWPPPGQIPLQAIAQGRLRGTLDQTGWSIQSDSINLQTAQVTVSSDGMDLPVTTTALMSGYGSRYALRFNPNGWTTTAGKTYKIKVGGVSMPIEYDVEVVDCAR